MLPIPTTIGLVGQLNPCNLWNQISGLASILESDQFFWDFKRKSLFIFQITLHSIKLQYFNFVHEIEFFYMLYFKYSSLP